MPGQQKAPSFAKLPQSIALRYGISLSVFLLSSLLRTTVDPWLSSDHGFVLFLPGIILVTFFAGLGPAILTTILSGLVLWYVFVPPTHSFEITNLGDAIGLVAFVLASGTGIALIHWLRLTLVELQAAREQAEALAGQREAVIDRTPFMLCRLGRDMRYRFISQAYARMIDRPPEEVVGRHIADILRPQGFDAVRPYIETVLRGESTEYELEINLPGVGPRLLRGIYTPERDARGNVDGWIASIVDIGEQKRTELLRRQLADIVDSSNNPIISAGIDGVIVTWNPGAERVFGYSADEVVGRSNTILIPPELTDATM